MLTIFFAIAPLLYGTYSDEDGRSRVAFDFGMNFTVLRSSNKFFFVLIVLMKGFAVSYMASYSLTSKTALLFSGKLTKIFDSSTSSCLKSALHSYITSLT